MLNARCAKGMRILVEMNAPATSSIDLFFFVFTFLSFDPDEIMIPSILLSVSFILTSVKFPARPISYHAR